MKPLKIKNALQKAPQSQPIYSVKIKNSKNEEVTLADPRATRSMLALMDLGAVNGGAACHWGGPSAMTELWTALHSIMFKESHWFEKYNFVNDIGHAENGIYALRANLGYGDLTLETLKGFRSIKSKLTGHGESHLYPEGVLLSNGPLASALPQAQGLAMADALAGNNRLTICSISDGASMEGEAKEAFAAIPGLAAKGKLAPFLMIVSDNNTKLGGRIDKDSFSMQPTFSTLETLGWNVVKLEEGNDLAKSLHALELAMSKLDPKKPIALWAKTVKGYGNKSTVESSSGGHGFPLKAHDEAIHNFLKEIWDGAEVPKEFTSWANELTVKPEKKSSSGVPKDKIQIGVSKALVKAAKEGLPVYSLSCDLAGSTGLKAFQSECPTHFQDVGIAESNMVSAAAGMSKLGFIPVVDTFAAFGVTKGNLPLVMASLSESPVIAIFSHTGFQDAADGASHQSLTYMSALASIPNTVLVNLATAKEAEEYVYQAIKEIASLRESSHHAPSFIFFLGRENFPLETKEGLTYKIGAPQVIEAGSDAMIVATGSLLEEARAAAEMLKAEGKSVAVIQHAFVNRVDGQLMASMLKKSGSKLVTVEDHQLIAGMGAMLSHSLLLSGADFKLKSLGVKGEFGQSSYTAKELYQKHGLDREAIVKAVKALL
ncbi:MAG: transketolase [Bacteriovoracaceae bacterium]|nr:transketolase [Bacteriovoracaceae bacterium]